MADDDERRPKGLRIKGHRLTVDYSGEVGDERSSTGYCTCGWSESHTAGWGVRQEYSWHLDDVWSTANRGEPGR